MAKKYCKSSELTNEDHLILSLSANILAGILANGNTWQTGILASAVESAD